MRNIKEKECVQRGCKYCLRMIPPPSRFVSRKCPYDECPYHELDGVKTYAEYLKKTKEECLVKLLEELEKKNL